MAEQYIAKGQADDAARANAQRMQNLMQQQARAHITYLMRTARDLGARSRTWAEDWVQLALLRSVCHGAERYEVGVHHNSDEAGRRSKPVA